MVGVYVGVTVFVCVTVGVLVEVDVFVRVLVGVIVEVGVFVEVEVFVGVGHGAHSLQFLAGLIDPTIAFGIRSVVATFSINWKQPSEVLTNLPIIPTPGDN
jgi:hypothetical protein